MPTISFDKEYLNPPQINILDGGYVSLDCSWRSEKEMRSPYACFYFIESGSAVLTENGNEIVMEKNRAYFIPTGTSFGYYCKGSMVKLFVHISMIGNNGFDILERLKGIHSCEISNDELSAMIYSFSKRSITDSLSFRRGLYDILIRIMRTYPENSLAEKAYSSLVKNAMSYIQENLSISLMLKDIAAHLFIAEVTLRKRFKAETGITPRQYIENLVFFKAELLLRTTSYSIKDISNSLGFCDQFYFSRRFLKLYFMSPRKYRMITK